MTHDFEGLTAIVTGGGGGLGRAHVLTLTALGTNVVINDLPATDGSPGPATLLAQEVQSKGGSAVAVDGDASRHSHAAELISAAMDNFGTVDAVVCNAGIHRVNWLEETPEEEWDLLMNVHLKGTFALTRAAVLHWGQLSDPGPDASRSIICTTSQSGLYGGFASVAYDTMKGGVASFVRSASSELKRHGVRVNGVAPRGVTQMSHALVRRLQDMGVLPADFAAGDLIKGKNGQPLRIEDCTPVVAWLAGRGSKDVTGQIFEVSSEEITLVDGWSRRASVGSESGWTLDAARAAAASLLPDLQGV